MIMYALIFCFAFKALRKPAYVTVTVTRAISDSNIHTKRIQSAHFSICLAGNHTMQSK